MQKQTFKIQGEYIELIKLLKASGVVGMGSDAKYLVSNGAVKLNGMIELRLRAKIRPGDRIQVNQIELQIE